MTEKCRHLAGKHGTSAGASASAATTASSWSIVHSYLLLLDQRKTSGYTEKGRQMEKDRIKRL